MHLVGSWTLPKNIFHSTIHRFKIKVYKEEKKYEQDPEMPFLLLKSLKMD